MKRKRDLMNIEDLVATAAKKGASDVHLIAGLPPKCRIDGQIQNIIDTPLTHDDCEELARQMAGSRYDLIKDIGELDAGGTIAGERVRINLFREQGNVSTALRILSNRIPPLSVLGLPKVVDDFPTYNKGIVLVTGETGSGKSTTLAAILDQINHTRNEHIITLEDPIEYVYKPDKCIINQREIGADTRSYADGLRAILREDPDIILIGEMRDLETVEIALTAAETGHLVFATLHTNSAVDSIDRMVGIFPEARQQQIRLQLSTTLRAVLSQQLLARAGGHGRIVACEVMLTTPAIQNLIREGKTPQMQSFLLSSKDQGAVTMDNCLVQMVMDGKIKPDTAVNAAADRDYVRKKVGFSV
ncbi:MAG: PilT/PilU family type 4a pilus ATPase [Oribacterium sp.]|nr:PilT/PilU family type 4a pilus ATPase [Oribacterium sp.]